MLKKSRAFYELQLTQQCKKTYSATQPEILLTLQIFAINMFLVVLRKNICTVPFLDVQKQHSRNTWKPNACMFLYISVGKFCSRDVGNFYLVREWIIALRRLTVWNSENVLKFLILIEIFGNLTIFQYFYTSINSIETLKFSRQFGIQG